MLKYFVRREKAACKLAWTDGRAAKSVEKSMAKDTKVCEKIILSKRLEQLGFDVFLPGFFAKRELYFETQNQHFYVFSET